MFSCEFCKIFKNTYFEEPLRTTASKQQKLNAICQLYNFKNKINPKRFFF